MTSKNEIIKIFTNLKFRLVWPVTKIHNSNNTAIGNGIFKSGDLFSNKYIV